jgi:coenzyme F420-0:L-glutamate ligase/coenzyme F420-1:gamma-L-glutamate ligase
MTISITPIGGLPLLRLGDDLAAALFDAMDRAGLRPADRDILVVCQKAVSKTEGRVVDLRTVTPSDFAVRIAAGTDGKDPRIVEVILREATRIVKMAGGHLVVETGPGWVCANAGVDESNSGDPNLVVLLPRDPDAAARQLRAAAAARYGCDVAVIVTDTFGRPWRQGLVDFALGVAGIAPLLDLRGTRDLGGRELHHTVLAHVDALAAAAGLVMQKGAGIPAALVRGYDFAPADGRATELIRPRETDLFR